MPAEWEPHEATWIAWPHHEPDWPGKLDAVCWVYAEIVRVLCTCERVEIEGNKVNGKILCNLILTGTDITKLQLDYLNGKASANILDLRRMVGQVHAWVSTAKKKFKRQLQTQEVQP